MLCRISAVSSSVSGGESSLLVVPEEDPLAVLVIVRKRKVCRKVKPVL